MPSRDEMFRDECAVKAMELFSLGADEIAILQRGEWPQHDIVARFCFDLAAAMVAERKQREGRR